MRNRATFVNTLLTNLEKCFPVKRTLKGSFGLPKSSFGEHELVGSATRGTKAEMRIFETLYAPQTKILEGGTKDEIRIFEALFNGVVAQIEYSRP